MPEATILGLTVFDWVVVGTISVGFIKASLWVSKWLVDGFCDSLRNDYFALVKGEEGLEKSEHGLDRNLDRAELERIAKEHLLETDNTSPSKKGLQAYINEIPEERQNSTRQGEAVNERATNAGRSCLESEMGRR